MNRRTFLIATGAAGTALAFGSEARADDVADAFAAITKAREGLKTLVGTFKQERVISLLATALKSDGEMTFVRPDQLRWEYKPPDSAVYWVTPQGFAMKTPNGTMNAGQSAAGKFAAVLPDMMILLGGDLSKLRARYDVSVPKNDKDGLTLLLKPKAAEVAQQVKSIELGAESPLWKVKKIVIEEKSGDRSVIVFDKLERDVNVDPAKMKPPPK